MIVDLQWTHASMSKNVQQEVLAGRLVTLANQRTEFKLLLKHGSAVHEKSPCPQIRK